MVTYVFQSATPAVGENVLSGFNWAKAKTPMRVVKISITGGSAVYDGRFELSYGSEKIAETYNMSTTEIDAQNEEFGFWISSKKVCEPGDEIALECKASASANYRILLDIREGRN